MKETVGPQNDPHFASAHLRVPSTPSNHANILRSNTFNYSYSDFTAEGELNGIIVLIFVRN